MAAFISMKCCRFCFLCFVYTMSVMKIECDNVQYINERMRCKFVSVFVFFPCNTFG